MDAKKLKKLETSGWKTGDARDFLGLTDVETKLVDLKVERTLITKNKEK